MKRIGMWSRALLTVCACTTLTLGVQMPHAEAVYDSGDLTSDVRLLDYIENRRRVRREERLSDAQKELKKDAQEMQRQVKGPVDPARLPLAIEGDDMFYDEKTGEVYAKGSVRVTELDAKRILTEAAQGNLKSGDVRVDDKARLLQTTIGSMPLDMDVYRVVYNYKKQIGSAEDAEGRIGPYHFAGKRIEFYPDRILIYNGWQTKCSAKYPDYRVSGDLIEIYPGKELLVHEARYWLKNKVVYSRALYRQDLSKSEEHMQLPRVGYDSDNGSWIKYKLQWPVGKRADVYADLRYFSHHNMRNIYGLSWNNGGNSIEFQYGDFYDSNNVWIKKRPTMEYHYKNRIGKAPFSYDLKYEIGRWKQCRSGKWMESTHQYYGVTLTPDAIKIGSPSFRLMTSFGYGITKETYDDSNVTGFDWSATLLKEFGDEVALYAKYSYNAINAESTLFNYDVDDYARKLTYGISVAVTPRDRFMMGQSYDLSKRHQQDIDYYWFHDMHCAQLIARYRARRDTWSVTLQFTPW